MGSDWIPVIGTLSFTALIISVVAISQITKYKLRLEQIKADAMVKSEEIRAKNQLEMEALYVRDRDKTAAADRHAYNRFTDSEETPEMAKHHEKERA